MILLKIQKNIIVHIGSMVIFKCNLTKIKVLFGTIILYNLSVTYHRLSSLFPRWRKYISRKILKQVGIYISHSYHQQNHRISPDERDRILFPSHFSNIYSFPFLILKMLHSCFNHLYLKYKCSEFFPILFSSLQFVIFLEISFKYFFSLRFCAWLKR